VKRLACMLHSGSHTSVLLCNAGARWVHHHVEQGHTFSYNNNNNNNNHKTYKAAEVDLRGQAGGWVSGEEELSEVR